MTGRERLLAVLRGETPDKLPALSVCQYATYGLMEETGASWPEAHSDGEKMARLAAGGASVLHFDAVRVPYCQTVEAEAFGATVKSGGRLHIPSIEKPAFTLGETPVVPPDFLSRGRVPAVLDAIRRLKAEVGTETAVMGSIVGPFSVAASLVGITALLKATFRKPETLRPYLEAALATAISYAHAVEAAGADVLVIEDMMASLDMISPKTYRALAAPYEKRLIAAVQIPVIVHICGKLDAVMEDIAATGAAAISVESSVDIRAARDAFDAKGIRTPIFGAVHPIKVLFEGSADDVRAAVARSADSGAAAVSPDCAVAPGTGIDKLRTLADAAHAYRIGGATSHM